MRNALVALGMGGPDSTAAIEPFLRNLLTDREIIDFGVGKTLQTFIASRIASKRSRIIAPHYEKMGGGSPQLAHTEALLKKVAAIYRDKTGTELDTYVGMCYWHPFIEDTMKNLIMEDKREPYDTVFFLPMYPQYSSTTAGACYIHLEKALKYAPVSGKMLKINHFHLFGPYLDALSVRIKAAAERLGKNVEDVHILFSAHSLPQSVVDAGDPYVNELNAQIKALTAKLSPKSSSLAYQSKLGRMKWLMPSTKQELERLSLKGITDIVILAISFINDHIETLIELDDDLIPQGRKLGINIERAETLNSSDDFAAAVVSLLTGAKL